MQKLQGKMWMGTDHFLVGLELRSFIAGRKQVMLNIRKRRDIDSTKDNGECNSKK